MAERDTVEPLRMGFGQESDYAVLRFSQPRPEPSRKGFFIGRTKGQCVSKKAQSG